MKRTPSHYTVAAYYQGLKSGEITVNKAYQRSDEVWPAAARSFLIETVLKNFPIPTIYLHQKTDFKTKKTTAEIVDGQQRSVALRDFIDDEFALSNVIEDLSLQGLKFSGLDDDSKQQILEYQLDIDLFTSANPDEVVEVFRRMNSYTVPLNPEEKRHAQNQGKFKWFINRMADSLSVLLAQMGVFSRPQQVRMQDNKLLTDLCDSFEHGIRTTKAKELDLMYKAFDISFPRESEYQDRLVNAFDFVRKIEGIGESRLVKPFLMYSLVQAVTHMQNPVVKFESDVPTAHQTPLDFPAVARNLLSLNAAFSSKNLRFESFVEASKSKTNVTTNRVLRFQTLSKALYEDFTA